MCVEAVCTHNNKKCISPAGKRDVQRTKGGGKHEQQRFRGKAVIVTGGAQGMGRTIAEQFLQQGARVLIFDLDTALATETAQQLTQNGGMREIVSIGGSVSRREDVHRAVETCIAHFGRLDVMVAQAGIADAQPLLEIEDAVAAHYRCQPHRRLPVYSRGSRAMARSGGGTIVAMASTNAFQVEENLSHYNTSKGGVVAFVRSAAIDLARYGIRVNAVAPGVVLTRLSAWITEDPIKAGDYLKQIPLKRFAEALDVAKAVLFLASSDSSYITGQTLVVDGGQTLGIMVDAPTTPFPGLESSTGKE